MEAYPKPKVHGVSVLNLGLGVEGIVQLECRPERLLLLFGRIIEFVFGLIFAFLRGRRALEGAVRP